MLAVCASDGIRQNAEVPTSVVQHAIDYYLVGEAESGRWELLVGRELEDEYLRSFRTIPGGAQPKPRLSNTPKTTALLP